jgi:tetratricopeptide (TPR) repeat protein
MNRDARFWVALAGFELLFGLAVFGATRQYYLAAARAAHPAVALRPATSSPWEDVVASNQLLPSDSSAGPAPGMQAVPGAPEAPASTDPSALSRQADQLFADKQYDRAAAVYAQLLTLAPESVDVYNNLGLTLHYLGRSTEALQKLEAGIAIDPNYQRIWLTLGFVNSDLGNVEEARTALKKATQIGTDEKIRESATKMLAQLPPPDAPAQP